MYFGEKYLNEARDVKVEDGIGTTANVIAHMIKYESDKQKHKQSFSWANTIINGSERLVDNEVKAGKKKTNYVSSIKKEYDKKVLADVNRTLKKDGTGLNVKEIPDKFSYENITDRDFIMKFIFDNMHNSNIAKELKSKGIDVPQDVINNCDR